MKFFILFLTLALGSWSTPPSKAPATAEKLPTFQFQEGSEMTVHGSSNVRDWTMDVQTINGEVVVQPANGGDAPTVDRIQVEVPVEDIVSDRDAQTSKAHDALQRNAYSVIYFNSNEVEVSTSGEDAFPVVARGELIIAGERRTVDLQAEGMRQENGTYRFQGEHDLRLSDFDVKRPTALLGTLRVSDEITLSFDVTVAPE